MENNIPIYKFAIREDLEDTGSIFLPTRAEPAATGWDVRAAQQDRQPLIIKPNSYIIIPLGFRAIPPKGWWFALHPRSSSFMKKFIHGLIGVIDEHYPEEVMFGGHYLPSDNKELIINFKDPIGQIIPVKREEMITIQISNDDYNKCISSREAVRKGGIGSTW